MAEYEPQLACVDASARLGSAVAQAGGPEGFAQVHDARGHELHLSALTADMAVANAKVPGDTEGFTYVCPKGHEHRIGYSLADQVWQNRVKGVQAHSLF